MDEERSLSRQDTKHSKKRIETILTFRFLGQQSILERHYRGQVGFGSSASYCIGHVG